MSGRLPIGIQDFRTMREQDFYYVDKTPLVRQLVDDGRFYFLSRPRRFGKSLLLDTLRSLLRWSRGTVPRPGHPRTLGLVCSSSGCAAEFRREVRLPGRDRRGTSSSSWRAWSANTILHPLRLPIPARGASGTFSIACTI